MDVDSGCLARLLFQLYEYVLRKGLYHTDENEIPHDNHDSGSLVCVIATAGLIPVLGLYGAGAASILCNAVIYVMRMINSRRLVSIDVNYCILVISIVLLGVQMMITAMAVPYYWVYGVLIFLVLTGMHGMRCVPLLRLVVGKRNR